MSLPLIIKSNAISYRPSPTRILVRETIKFTSFECCHSAVLVSTSLPRTCISKHAPVRSLHINNVSHHLKVYLCIRAICRCMTTVLYGCSLCIYTLFRVSGQPRRRSLVPPHWAGKLRTSKEELVSHCRRVLQWDWLYRVLSKSWVRVIHVFIDFQLLWIYCQSQTPLVEGDLDKKEQLQQL